MAGSCDPSNHYNALNCVRGHRILREWVDDTNENKKNWVVDVKTFFDIAHCYFLDRVYLCKCTAPLRKCEYCRSIWLAVHSAYYFAYRNKKRNDVS